ncbi:chromate efflux transporter [Sphingomonas sp. SUN039]|uniref:chromate efflux transporter n=1 Tax=Sphingomonas sp. SUN039 TaxID=2937787 RepID=UPI0021645E97|nr:chromate efflux transporter [Sphingomonas sp. SUN039]UVO53203.1 chromate efflux transporter [Sphingomonas sp. SUN039]
MTHGITLREATSVWWRIALLSFGGPAGQIAVMHRILIDEKRWIGERRFLHALNFCMLLPGPEAQQLATYIGWLLHGVRGGLIAGLLFVLPGAVAILALSWIYVLYGNVGPIEALFFGLKAAVLAIVVQAVVRIGGRALKSVESRALAAAAFVAIFFLAAPFPLIVVVAGTIGWIAGRRGSHAFSGDGHGGSGAGLADADSALGDGPVLHPPSRTRNAALVLAALWLLPVAALALFAPQSVWTDIATFFSRMAVVTFGGAYAVLAYVAQQGVDHYGWLSAREMLDGLGLAETTPGPLIMVTQFVGFLGAFRASTGLPPLLAGTLGAVVTTWVTFLPCFVWIFAGAPFIERLRGNTALASALGAITAAVVGVILNLAIWFALHFLFARVQTVRAGPLTFDAPVPASIDPMAAGLSVLAVLWLFVLKRSVFETLAVAAAGGVVLRMVLA